MLLLKARKSLRLTLMWLHNKTRVHRINILCHQREKFLMEEKVNQGRVKECAREKNSGNSMSSRSRRRKSKSRPLKVKRNKTIFLQQMKIIKPVLMLWIHINRKMIEKPARMKYQPMIRGRKRKCKTLKIAGNKPMRIQNLMHY